MGRFNYNNYTLSDDERVRTVQEKFINGESLSVIERFKLGRDNTEVNFLGYECKPDCAYRAVGEDGFKAYMEDGNVFNPGEDFTPENGNAGVDWFLGAVGSAYAKKGGYIIECPAEDKYFVSTNRYQAMDPRAQHLKSGSENPIPLKYCRIMSVDEMMKGNYEDVKAEKYPYEAMPETPPPQVERLSKEDLMQEYQNMGVREPEIVIEHYEEPQVQLQEELEELDIPERKK